MLAKAILVMGVLILAGCDLGSFGSSGTAGTVKAIDQVTQEQTQRELNLAIQKRITDIQLEVAKACADRKGIPVFLNGNVDCKFVGGK